MFTFAPSTYTITSCGLELTLLCPIRDYWVYLYHFDEPIGNQSVRHGTAQHYLGFTRDVLGRMAAHKAGISGAKLMEAVHKAGIGIQLARLWRVDSFEAGHTLERYLKAKKAGPALCPICSHRPFDAYTLLLQGHYPFHVFAKPGPRQPIGAARPVFLH